MSLSYNYSNQNQRKCSDLLTEIRRKVENRQYLDTRHASDRQSERKITRLEILYVLQQGYHEKRKDHYDFHHRAWNYAIRGKTADKRDIRVIISFNQENMLIVTAIEIVKGHLT